MPARQSAGAKSSSVTGSTVADLDAILSSSVEFKLHGKYHVLSPLTVEQFMVFTSKLTEVYALREKSGVTASELIDIYYELAHSACPSIKREDIEEMTNQQVAALFDVMISTVTGKIHAEKKTL